MMNDRSKSPGSPQSRIRLGDDKRKSRRTLYLALAFGVCAALANLIAFQQAEGTRITVLKAKAKLPPGTRVTSSNFAPVVIAGVPNEMRSIVVESKSLAAYQKIPLATPVQAGELLMQSSFSTTNNDNIRDLIPDGYRALALKVKDESSALDWQVGVGDTVDVYAASGLLIIPQVRVNAVGDSTLIPGSDAKYRTVTIVIPKSNVSDVLKQIQLTNEQIRLAVVGPSGQ
jgi:Flp pilus assembly protein CpaB